MACWAYTASVLGLFTLLRGLGDCRWLATVLLYGPRWVWVVPLGVLIPAAVVLRPRSLRVLSIAAFLVIGPVMGFCVPWGALPFRNTGGHNVRVMTCNASGGLLGPEAFGTLIAQTRPDIVALQEWSAQHESVVFRLEGWHIQAGGGRHCLASRYPIRAVEVLPPHPRSGRVAVIRYDLVTSDGILHVFNLHLATPRDGLEPMLASGWKGVPALRASITLRREESEAASRWVGRVDGPILIAGDFNLTGDSVIYRRSWSGYRDAFSTAGLGLGYTKYTRWFGVRIDHILAGPGWRIRHCWTGPDVGSDHRPVIAEISWVGMRR